MKRVLALIFALCLLTGCGAVPAAPAQESDTRTFTDSVGRTVTLPEEVTKIAVSGPLTQIYVLPLAEDLLVGVSNRFAEAAAEYLPESVLSLPDIGQLYGGKGELDLEALLAADPDVVIDVGETKDSIAEDLDALTEQTGIPFVHIDATVQTAPKAYRLLGQLLGRPEEAETIALWCEEAYSKAEALMSEVDSNSARKSLLYCLGDTGTNVLANGSFHAETIALMGDNLAVVDQVVSQGSGNETDLEQIMVWNPDVILFAPDSIYNSVAELDQWQSVPAIENGSYYNTPSGPYGWLSSPPSVQRYLGMLWLGELLYPEYNTEYDLQEEVTEYYQLFYGCELTDEMYDRLMEGALPNS